MQDCRFRTHYKSSSTGGYKSSRLRPWRNIQPKKPLNDECTNVFVSNVANMGRSRLSNIYNGLYQMRETDIGTTRWRLHSLNRNNQPITTFLERAWIKVGHRSSFGWIIGYDINSEIRIRFYSTSPSKCPDDTTRWQKVHRLKKFRYSPARKISYFLGKKTGTTSGLRIVRANASPKKPLSSTYRSRY